MKSYKGFTQHLFGVNKIGNPASGKKGAGFTLIELLVVIAIIGILSTLALTAVSLARGKAKVAKARQEVDQIVTALKFLENDAGEWPGHQPIDVMCGNLPGGCPPDNEICSDGCAYGIASGYAGLAADDTDTPYTNWNGPYMLNIPLDPWGNEYFFDTDYNYSGFGDVVVVGSYGSNGEGNNLYDSDDIIKVIYQ